MRRLAALAAGVTVILALAVAQLVLPGIAAQRLRDRLAQLGTGAGRQVHAFPAVELLWHQADKVVSGSVATAPRQAARQRHLIRRRRRHPGLRRPRARWITGCSRCTMQACQAGDRLAGAATSTSPTCDRRCRSSARSRPWHPAAAGSRCGEPPLGSAATPRSAPRTDSSSSYPTPVRGTRDAHRCSPIPMSASRRVAASPRPRRLLGTRDRPTELTPFMPRRHGRAYRHGRLPPAVSGSPHQGDSSVRPSGTVHERDRDAAR